MNIIDNNPLLTPTQKSLLEQCARKPFMLGGYKSLYDILTKLKVDVFIEPGIPKREVDDYFDSIIEHWRKVYKKLSEMSREDESLHEECQKAEINIGRLGMERDALSAMKLLGLYDIQNNTIILYPQAMADADANKMDEYLVSTFAHEVMHAYFNRPRHEKYPSSIFVEEPLAEFGMLLYLHETRSSYYDWAHDNVSSKKCCYRYGADIMDQHLSGDRTLRPYLEKFKIPIGKYDMLDKSNVLVSMPKRRDLVDVSGQPFVPEWTPVYNAPPTYFWDDATKTLGLDGVWGDESLNNLRYQHHSYFNDDDIQHLYFGKNFVDGHHYWHLLDIFPSAPLTVSPQHKELTSINGIPVFKTDNTPALHNCGDGLFKLKRNGKYGIIDSQLNNITPFKYDFIWSFDKNGLCLVRIRHNNSWVHGLVNKQGEEQVPLIYEDITSKGDKYEVKQNGKTYIIDKLGNKQSEN